MMDTQIELKRIIDDEFDLDLHVFGAVLIDGPRGCGKTYTAKRRARSYLDLREGEKKEAYVAEARNTPSLLLNGDNPRLFIEWQKAPSLWDTVRKSVDKRNQKGLYILTGQSPERQNVQHSGIGRYSMLTMWPASLYESGESNGGISLGELLDGANGFRLCRSNLSVAGLIDCMCRGGWPECVLNPGNAEEYVKSLFEKACGEDVPEIVNGRKGENLAREIVCYYAQNLGRSPRDFNRLLSEKCSVSRPTLAGYASALKQLYVIEDIPPLPMDVRDITHRTMSGRCNVVDPSFAAIAAGACRKDLDTDYDFLNRLFECLCYRDLKVYSSARVGTLYYYMDRLNLEVDCVLNYDNYKYALIDFCLGQSGIDRSAKNLCRLERLIVSHKERSEFNVEWLDYSIVKIVLTGTEYGYRRDDGVFVVPIGCLKD